MLDLFEKIRPVLYFVVAGLAYLAGYLNAQVEGDLKIEQLKAENAAAVINAQIQAKVNYEKQIEDLVAARAAEREHYAERLRQLEKFRSANGDLEACRRDRGRLAEVAIRFESLTIRAIDDLKTTLGH